MTNVKVTRSDVLSAIEFDKIIMSITQEPIEHYRLRNLAVHSILRRTGKRRGEVATLRCEDVTTKDKYLSLTFTVEKKRRRSADTISLRREKLLELSDPLAQYILTYKTYLSQQNPSCTWLFPRTHYSPLTHTLIVNQRQHLTGRQIFNIVKKYAPQTWPHLYRETVGADIIREDPSIIAPFKVMRRLDLESFTTAFNYMKRFAADIISQSE